MGPEHTHNHCTPMQPLPNVGVLRYLKDPVATISELYARYPDGGEYGWFALCTDTNQFAVWDTETETWKNSGLVPIEAYEESTQTPSANDYLLLYSVALQKAVKVKVSKIATGSSAVNVLKSETYTIDTGDFFPPATSMFPFLMTPGSYGVVFTDPPIAGLNETNFNLKVDYVSHDGSGADGDQDLLQTLTTKDGVSYTRRLYHVNGQSDMSATDFKTAGAISEVDTYVSSETYTRYTKINNAFIEL